MQEKLSDIWGAVDKPKRKRPEPFEGYEADWIQQHMNRIRDWMKNGIGLTHSDAKIMQILGCSNSEYDDLIINRPDHFSLGRIKIIHNNLIKLMEEGKV